MSKKLLSVGAILALVAAVFVGVASTASAQSMSLCQTVDALVAAGVIAPDKVAAAKAAAGCGSTTSSACYSFTKDLTVGSTGADVSALQAKLSVSPATGYFGAITKAAVQAYQTSKGISATGYVGPLTRAALNACVVTTTTTTTTTSSNSSLSGDEGQLVNIENTSADVENSLDEGEEVVNVYGVEVEAEDSDMLINRIDVDFTLTDAANGSDNLEDYITEVVILNGTKEVAKLDVDEADVDDGSASDDLSDDNNDVYSFRFSDLKIMVEDGETAEIYVAVSAVNNIDSDDAGDDWAVVIPVDGIRATDGAGISETYVDSSDLDEENFSIEVAEAGNVDLTIDDADNEDRVIPVDADADTLNEEILVFVLEADASTNIVDSIEIDFATTTATSTLISDAVKRVKLYADGDLVGTENITGSNGSEKAVFDDLEIEIAEDEEIEFVVKADFNDEADTREGFSFEATVDASEIDVEDAEGDDVVVSGDVTGGEIELRTEGVIVTLADDPIVTKTLTADESGEKDIATYKIQFSVKANGADMWIDKSVQNTSSPSGAGLGVAWATTTESTGTTTLQTATLSASGSTASDSGTGYKISKGSTRTFTLQVTLESGQDGSTAVKLAGINYDTDSNTADSTTYYTFNLDDYKTELMFLNLY